MPGAFMVATVTRESPGPERIVLRRKLVPGLEYEGAELALVVLSMVADPRNLGSAGTFGSEVLAGGWRRDGLRDLVPAAGRQGRTRRVAAAARVQRRVRRRVRPRRRHPARPPERRRGQHVQRDPDQPARPTSSRP
ncbi:hypothetical protein ACFSTC_03360 [Nonomuraea ferruginea]